MFALVDCNNFFVSCERVFQPSLENRPVAVMSNNDGCLIARSNEVKALGIPMAAPVFKHRAELTKHNVALLSSNFALYSDFSNRVMEVLSQFSPEVIIYSVDEAFLDISDLHIRDYAAWAATIRQRVTQWTGIPVSIGIAPTKTLAKIANQRAKKDPTLPGVLVLDTPAIADHYLGQTPVDDVWGIGLGRTPFLRGHGIATARQLRDAHPGWVQQHLTVGGARTQRELRGESCIELSGLRRPTQTIMCTRSFGRKITEYHELEQAVVSYASQAAERLRRQKLVCRKVVTYIRSGHHGHNPFRGASTATISISEATDYTPRLVKAALQGLQQVYQPGLEYSKAGVILVDLVLKSHRQLSFQPQLISTQQRKREAAQMSAVDHTNHQLGGSTVRLAVHGFNHPWMVKSAHRSPRYTTRWDELRTVSAGE